MSDPAIPAVRLRCPLCGASNGCVPASSGTFDAPCWCAGRVVPPAARAVLASAGDACACAACLARLADAALEPREEARTPGR